MGSGYSGEAIFVIALIIGGSIVGCAFGFTTPVGKGRIEEMRIGYGGDNTHYKITVNGKEYNLLFELDYMLLNVNDCVTIYFFGNVQKINCEKINE